MWMLIFFVLPVLAIAYVSWHVWVLFPLASWWKLGIIGISLACFASMFINFGGRRLDTMPLTAAQWSYEIGTSSLIILLYIFMLFLVLDLGRLVHLVPRSWLFHNGTSALVMLGVIVVVFIYGNLHYKNKVRVPLEITTQKKLAKSSYRMVMLSDLHLGYHNQRAELARWVDMINAERPDMILIAGDIIDISIRPLLEEGMAAEFRRLEAPVYACLGNHEYYSGEPRARQFYKDAGIHLLIDESTLVDSCITIIGRDDRTNHKRKSVQELTSPSSLLLPSSSTFTILLDHQPYELEKTEQAGIDFQLSGHTHRGQVWPISWITDAIYECSWGSHQRGDTHYYVSSGMGIWGGMFRIGTQSEYAVLTLRAASAKSQSN